MRFFTFLSFVIFNAFSTTASAQEIVVDPETVSQLAIGETFTVDVTIVSKGDWGSSSKDIEKRLAEFAAPPGLVILDHEISSTGHHSYVAWERTVPAGNISYSEGVGAQLKEEIRKGMLSGALTYEGVDMGSAEGAFAYAKFLREFDARYQIVLDKNSTISFAWGMHTKNGRHGAKLDASARIVLQRYPLEGEVASALEVLKFVNENGNAQEVMDIIEAVFNDGKKSAAELGLTPEVVAEGTLENPEAAAESP